MGDAVYHANFVLREAGWMTPWTRLDLAAVNGSLKKWGKSDLAARYLARAPRVQPHPPVAIIDSAANDIPVARDDLAAVDEFDDWRLRRIVWIAPFDTCTLLREAQSRKTGCKDQV